MSSSAGGAARLASVLGAMLSLAGCTVLFPFDLDGDAGRDGGAADADEPRDAGEPRDAQPDGDVPDADVPVGAWTDLTLGRQFTCGIREPGDVYCWGLGAAGRLADLRGVDQSTPVQVSVGGLALEVEAGDSHTCAIVEDGDARRIMCWGVSLEGQTGEVTTTVATPREVPIPGGRLPVQLALGDEHSCVRTDANDVWCWGSDREGQLGDTSAGAIRTEATQAALTGPATDLSSGDEHVCALLETGEVECWGSTDVNQIRDREAGDVVQAPLALVLTDVTGPVTDVELGGDITCVLNEAREIFCRGQANNGQVPDASGLLELTEIAGVDETRRLAVGGRQMCALDVAGDVRCWGEASFGALGRDTFDSGTLLPGVVDGIADATLVASGFRHTCVAAGRTLSCFGTDGAGESGRGAALVQRTPMLVGELGGRPALVSAGEESTCTRLEDGRVQCWGDGAFGRLGYGRSTDSSTPQLVRGSAGELTGVDDIVVGYRNACAGIGSDTWCWGGASGEQLGHGATGEANTEAFRADVPSNWTGGMDLGDRFACWLTDAGAVGCVGANSSDQLGRVCSGAECGAYLTAPDVMIPSPDQLALGDAHVCVAQGTELECWGRSDRGQLGGTQAGPINLPADIAHLDAGADTTCAALVDRSVYCWGDNRSGQAGRAASDFPDVSSPEQIEGVNALRVAVGDQFACAMNNDSVWCWGSDTFGQLGRGAPATSSSPAPVALPPGSGVEDLDAGHLHACAVLDNSGSRNVYCWGSDRYGRLGSARDLQHLLPAEVTTEP